MTRDELATLLSKISASAWVSGANDTEHHPDEYKAKTQIIEAFAKTQRAVEAMKKYKQFFISCSCYFAEGVEFMSKEEIYETIKREVKQLELYE